MPWEFCFGAQSFQDKQIWEESFVLLGIDGALLFGGEEQSEQVVQQSVSQQDEVG